MKNDKFKKARGGYSRILEITCSNCNHHISYYQKDGPGHLKRMYLDRMVDFSSDSKELACSKCKQKLGTYIIYEKENRPAYRLYVGAISKQIMKSGKLAF